MLSLLSGTYIIKKILVYRILMLNKDVVNLFLYFLYYFLSFFLQYLEFNGFDKCCSVFLKECDQKSKPVATHSIKSKSNQKLVAIQVMCISYNSEEYKCKI